ncbi:DUF3306 domain-containing protein [Pseudoduganella sp. GCM10020061]|uniref:DUF3306 domain-containing protein n=1 Tax=Pseudoduganella sp. GCM10020061 TaxID=3317345 RepID=UPI0036367A35
MGEGFLSRWSRLKTEAGEAPQAGQGAAVRGTAAADAGKAPVPAPPHGDDGSQPAQEQAPRALPSTEDAMRLGPDSDYAAFVARGVDAQVRRQALRKLFSDPHFNTVDGLDVYMGDYTRSDPIPPAMLASLRHANAWLNAQLEEVDDKAAPPPGAAHPQADNKATAPQRAPAGEHDEH